MPQIDQDYFKLLPFTPAAIPSLALEEVIAEKIRAASQRSKIRDLHDLSEIVARPIDRARVRALAVLKLWHSTGPGLDFQRFQARIMEHDNYDISDLRNLLRRDQTPDLEAMIKRVIDGLQFLGQLSDSERTLTSDMSRRAHAQAAELAKKIQGM